MRGDTLINIQITHEELMDLVSLYETSDWYFGEFEGHDNQLNLLNKLKNFLVPTIQSESVTTKPDKPEERSHEFTRDAEKVCPVCGNQAVGGLCLVCGLPVL